MAVWQDAEADAFRAVLDRFEATTGATVTYTSTAGEDITAVLDRRIGAGNPPDVAVLPQPGLLERYARSGDILAVDDLVGDTVRSGWAPVWQRLGSVDGELYGVWFKAANKSLVWYSIGRFEDAGVVPPDDLAGLGKVADQFAADGVPAFSLPGVPSDAWVLTDWFENLYLRLAGPDRYDALAEHRLPWTDPSVAETLRMMADLLSPARTVRVDGPETDFPDSVGAVLSTDPAAAMVMEGDFVPGVVAGTTRAQLEIDADVFDFPGLSTGVRYVVGAGDAAVLMRPSDGGQALLRYLGVTAGRRGVGRPRGLRLPERERRPGRLPDRHRPADRPFPPRGRRPVPLRPLRPATRGLRRHHRRRSVVRALRVPRPPG